MTSRVASCNCGQLRVTCEGEPGRISICHCLECQKRTGSVFATQARFTSDAVIIEGDATRWTRGAATFGFCTTCGSTVYWEFPGFIYVAVGAFADQTFPPPTVSVYEERRHPWALAAGQLTLEHHS